MEPPPHILAPWPSSPAECVRITERLRDVAVTTGEDARFECELSQPDVMEVEWRLGASVLQNNDLNQMCCQGCRHKLVLRMLTPDDSGLVAFTVGEERTAANLLVLDKPKGRGKKAEGGRWSCSIDGSPSSCLLAMRSSISALFLAWLALDRPNAYADCCYFFRCNGMVIVLEIIFI